MKSQHAQLVATPIDGRDRLLLPPDQLRRVLQRERYRADRNGSSFCLLIFTFAKPRSKRDELVLADFADILARRLRLTDDAGLLATRAVGIVLPNSDADGAWTLARDLQQRLHSTVTTPEIRVYTYPSDPDVDTWEPEDTPPDPHIAHDGPVHAMERLFVRPLPIWKRLMDLLGGVFGLMFFLPVMLVAGVGIKLFTPGPLYFKQVRRGLGGRPFVMYKFRTMVLDAEVQRGELLSMNEQDGPIFKIKNDPRITPWGKILRKTSIDELPQLWNVIKGDMSLVGPRPPLPNETEEYRPWYRRRLDVTPGITCIWQVEGRSTVRFEDWMRMDMRYIQRRSLWNDLRLIFKTVPAVLTGKGAS